MASETIVEQIQIAVEKSLPGAVVEVSGGGGHFTIDVTSGSFEGQSAVTRQRSVYRAIKHLMSGDAAPVHAVDRLTTRVP